MKYLFWLALLYVSCLYRCWISEVNGQEDFMLVGGPLRVSDIAVNNHFDCSYTIPPGSKEYFEYLHSRGVTHFKVPLLWTRLLPTGVSSQPQQAVVTCFRTLLKQLLDVGLQPLVILHGSSVPEALKLKYGGWESQDLVEMFQQYAEFAFQKFGALANSGVTLDDVKMDQGEDVQGSLQNILQLNKNIYKLFHQMFPEKGVSSQPQQAVVTCFRTLLKQLLDVGLQPLVILHGSSVPEALKLKYGGWESQELVEMFQQYAEFAFQEFGALANSWVTLDDVKPYKHLQALPSNVP